MGGLRGITAVKYNEEKVDNLGELPEF